MTAIFAGDETAHSTGDEGGEGGASSAAASRATVDAAGDRHTAESVAAAVNFRATCTLSSPSLAPGPDDARADLGGAAVAVAAPGAVSAEAVLSAAVSAAAVSSAAAEKAAAENAASAAEKAAAAVSQSRLPPPEDSGKLEGEPVGARAEWPHPLPFCRHID